MNNLEKDFVEYPEALELKQIGFDEPCLFYYYGSNNLQSLIQIDMPRLVNHNESTFETCCSAPSYSQTFRWFRDNYDLHSYVDRTYARGYYIYEYFIDTDNQEYLLETYEKAERACLKNLIKLVKEKQK